MKETHTATFPEFALLCELGEGDVVTMNYRPKNRNLPCVALAVDGRTVAKTDNILRSYQETILFLGEMFDPDAGREVPLYCRDVRYIAAAIRYIRHWRFDNYNSDEETEPEVLQPFPDEKSAIAYLKEVGQWEIMNGNYSLYPLSNWQPI